MKPSPKRVDPSHPRECPAVLLAIGLALFATPFVPAQIKPQPAPPANPLAADPLNDNRTRLGHVLFFEEQVSSTRTVACATCHLPRAGGTDPRPKVLHPGNFPSALDDALGSAGVIRNLENGTYTSSAIFGLEPQGTRRKAPSVLTGAVFETLFWDGRAGGVFEDESNPPVAVPGLTSGAALESQAVGPPISAVEMAHIGATWAQVEARIANATPLALASDIPERLVTYIGGRGYPELFDEAFAGSDVAPGPGVTRRRFAMAVAAYQRSLLPQQAPVISGNLGGPESLAAWGGFLFEGMPAAGRAGCSSCHKDVGRLSPEGPTVTHVRKTDNEFHHIGVTPPDLDPGRFAVTGDPADFGAFKTSSLFNVALQDWFFHNGKYDTLEDVVDFYIRGGDFPNEAIVPLNLIDPSGQVNNTFGRAALVAYLKRFTDPRLEVADPRDLLPPYDRPILYTESEHVPTSFGTGTGSPQVPIAIAIEPPRIGNPSFTIGLKNALGGTMAELWLNDASTPGTVYSGVTVYLAETANLVKIPISVQGTGAGGGFASVSLPLSANPALIGTAAFAQWILVDPGGPAGLTASDAIEYVYF